MIPLAVSGAFHSPVMQPAASTLAQAIAATALHDATIPVISNISAMPLTTAEAIREELARQIASSVQWAGTIEYLVRLASLSLSKSGQALALTGMVKRIAKRCNDAYYQHGSGY